jgi:hypothetical protein
MNKEGWSNQLPHMTIKINKFHYYKEELSVSFPYQSLCGMFFLKRLKVEQNLDSNLCKRCLKSLEKEKRL